ncbi:MAG TPA: hypothetical protein VHM02_15405 [Thermoanaerobaculia bacterium]|nr:hypothetical protein [Thermoanaerobaculia bacterium]
MPPLGVQAAWLLLLALPVACVAWTVTHEEIFRDLRRRFAVHVRRGKNPLERKFFYLFLCEYCFSHWVTVLFLALTRYHLLFRDWRGYLLAFFAVVWVANLYMSAFAWLRQHVKHQTIEAQLDELLLEEKKDEARNGGG